MCFLGDISCIGYGDLKGDDYLHNSGSIHTLGTLILGKTQKTKRSQCLQRIVLKLI